MSWVLGDDHYKRIPEHSMASSWSILDKLIEKTDLGKNIAVVAIEINRIYQNSAMFFHLYNATN